MKVSLPVVADSSWPHGLLQLARLLCPWDSPGRNTGVGCHSLLQGIFPTQWSNPDLPHCWQILYHLSHQGSSVMRRKMLNELCSVTQARPTLWDPMDHSLPGTSVHGIFQARILKWVAISFSWGSSWPRNQTCISCISCIAGRFFTPEPPGKLLNELMLPKWSGTMVTTW